MNTKIILFTLLLALFTRANAQDVRVTDCTVIDIVDVVNDANQKLNKIYKDSGSDAVSNELRSAIYATNDVLISIRGMVYGQAGLSDDKAKIVADEFNALSTSLSSLRTGMTDKDLINAISAINTKANRLKNKIKKIK